MFLSQTARGAGTHGWRGKVAGKRLLNNFLTDNVFSVMILEGFLENWKEHGETAN